jgi:hypothetical protein
MVGVVLYLFRRIYGEVGGALPLNVGLTMCCLTPSASAMPP